MGLHAIQQNGIDYLMTETRSGKKLLEMQQKYRIRSDIHTTGYNLRAESVVLLY